MLVLLYYSKQAATPASKHPWAIVIEKFYNTIQQNRLAAHLLATDSIVTAKIIIMPYKKDSRMVTATMHGCKNNYMYL